MEINVCEKIDQNLSEYFDQNGNGEHYNLKEIEIINRKPFNRGFFGNFVPHYVRYKNKEYILHGGIDYAYMHGQPSFNYIVI